MANCVRPALRHPRRTALALAGVLLLGGGGGVAGTWYSARSHLEAAERALRRYDLDAAQQHLDTCLGRWSGNERAEFLAAQTARRRDACADAERRLTAFEQTYGETEATRLEWVLLGVQQGDLAADERRL